MGQSRSQKLPELALRLWRFHAGNGLVSLAGNAILMYCLVERLKAPILPAAIGAIVLCSLANFLIADRWVYPLLGDYTSRGLVLSPILSISTPDFFRIVSNRFDIGVSFGYAR